MHLSRLGGTAIKIQAKPLDKDIVIVIDPYRPKQGDFPRSLAPDIALFTRGIEGSITISGNPFILATPGECETNGVLITSVQGHAEGTSMVRVDAEGVSVGHVGLPKAPLTETQIEALGNVDILFVPVGGGDSYDEEEAVKAVNAIEPRIVIPMHYKSDNDPSLDPVNAFLKEIGHSNGQQEKKLIVKKKDLPQEETKVVVLGKE